MNKELDELLVKKYPIIFKNRYGDKRETLMCWGFECGDGWFDIIDNLCNNIQTYIDEKNMNPVIAVQVKEKFGGLRFYYRGGDDKIRNMVDEAERKSIATCEYCGSEENVKHGRNKGWIETICDDCYERKGK